MLNSAAAWGHPVLNWRFLVDLPLQVLEPYLAERLWPSLQPERLARAIARTRCNEDRRGRDIAYRATGVDSFRQTLISLLPETLSRGVLDESRTEFLSLEVLQDVAKQEVA